MLEAKTIEKSIVDWPSIYCVQQVELSQFKLIPHLTSPDTVVCIRGCDQIRVFFSCGTKKITATACFCLEYTDTINFVDSSVLEFLLIF